MTVREITGLVRRGMRKYLVCLVNIFTDPGLTFLSPKRL